MTDYLDYPPPETEWLKRAFIFTGLILVWDMLNSIDGYSFAGATIDGEWVL